MQKLELISGSIDIIKNTNNDYVFLEVNPNGEYGFVSSHCNYNINRIIVKHVKKEIKNGKKKIGSRKIAKKVKIRFSNPYVLTV